MLDLDQLASRRARNLNQAEESWREVVWSMEFQKFSTNLSDGEIEQILEWCPSPSHVKALIPLLEESARDAGTTPFPSLLEIAKRARVEPRDWICHHLPVKG